LDNGLSKHFIDIQYQKQAYLDQEHRQFLVKPDYLLSSAANSDEILLVGDAKYKNPIYNNQVKPAEANLYQILTYWMKFNSNELVLFYPKFIRNELDAYYLNQFKINAGEQLVNLYMVEIDLLETDLIKLEQKVGSLVGGIINR
jgi:5-methylcytosine-specific restriction enzyme subunit McrC